jgi:hypothetical protein
MANGYPGGYPATSPGWRFTHSLWLLAPILGGSCFSGLGLLVVGLRARRPAWWIAGVTYLALAWSVFFVVGATPEKSTVSDIAVLCFLLLWLTIIVHSVAVNPLYLRWRAANVPWHERQAAYRAAPPPPPPPAPSYVDVNTATALEFVLALNLDGVRAQALVESRKARGGFASVEDFATVAELVPYELEALRSRLVCGPVDR